MKVCATVYNSLGNCLLNGYDLPTWIEGRLVDGLYCHPGLSVFRGDGPWQVTAQTIKPIEDLADPKGIRVWADIYRRQMPVENSRQQAIQLYDGGVRRLGIWDYYVRSPNKSQWSMIRLFGHRDELKSWRGKALSFARSHPLKSVCGMSDDPRYTPLTNG